MPSRKILIEVEVDTIATSPTEYTTSFRSPLLGGEMFLKSTHKVLAEYQIEFIDKTVKPLTEPIDILMKGAGELVTKVNDLRDMLSS